MKTEEPFRTLADIVTNFAKESQVPLSTDHFIEAMKDKARVSGKEIESPLSNKICWSAKLDHTKKTSGTQSLEISHTVNLDKARSSPDPEAKIFKIAVKGFWVDPMLSPSCDSEKTGVDYSFSYSTREFFPPFVSSVPVDLVSRVLKLAGESIGVGVMPEKPVTKARIAKTAASIPI